MEAKTLSHTIKVPKYSTGDFRIMDSARAIRLQTHSFFWFSPLFSEKKFVFNISFRYMMQICVLSRINMRSRAMLIHFYFRGTYIDDLDAPMPGDPCLTGL